MQNVYPPDRVLVSTNLPLTFEVSPTEQYVDIYTPEEHNAIISRYRTPNLFNGNCVRLDSLQNNHACISACCFYDFLCCNIVGIHNRDPLAYSKLSQYLAKYGRLNTFDKVIGIRELPNILGVSTLLSDINGDYLLVERNTKVSVGSGLFACTSSGSLDLTDINYENPIIGCGIRELKEELNITASLAIQGMIIPIQKMQPIALLTGSISQTWRGILPYMKSGMDYQKENNRLLIVPRDKLLSIISLYAFTDAAAFHIFFEAGGTKAAWKEVENTAIRIQDYYV